METTTVGEVTITVDDARAIRTSVEELLRTSGIPDPVPPPGEPFIDCEGTVRMSAWILEDGTPDLRLAYVIADTELVRVRQHVRIAPVEGKWKAVSTARVIYHKRR